MPWPRRPLLVLLHRLVLIVHRHDHRHTALATYDLRIGSSENEPTLPDAAVAGDDNRHSLSGQQSRLLSVAQLDPE